jgi:bifunctional DNA-binding transcriptional regulator/antitoxin component of YhaV-PrlF toxin-antitoxin module
MESNKFKTQIIGLGRITIPARERKFLKLKQGDWVEVTISKVPKEEWNTKR